MPQRYDKYKTESTKSDKNQENTSERRVPLFFNHNPSVFPYPVQDFAGMQTKNKPTLTTN